MHEADFDTFMKQESPFPNVLSVRERFAPILDRITKINRDTEIYPNIVIRHAPGHTPGEILIDIHEGDQRILLLGDVFHHPAELIDEKWIFNAPDSDSDPELAIKTRKQWIPEILKPNTIVTAAHFPNMQIGHVEKINGEYKWVKMFSL